MRDRTRGASSAPFATPPAGPPEPDAGKTDQSRGGSWSAERAPLSRGTAVLILAGSMTLLAAAVVFHAASQRYQATPLAGLYIMRTDRLTGRVEMCGARNRSAPVVCQTADLP